MSCTSHALYCNGFLFYFCLFFKFLFDSSSHVLGNGRLFSTDTSSGDPKWVEEPFKVEEAETVKMDPPATDQVLLPLPYLMKP